MTARPIDGAPLRQLSDASAAQNRAARPDVSVWVSANAGSGKTRVLTNRVARLLLAGADPSRILCITFTKAAAAEMQARLFKTLGDWTMAADDVLAAELDKLLDADEPAPLPQEREEARRLFARALETPGGLKIQTIHAFCEGLLARFPLEAGVSPHSSVIDDAAARELRAEACDQTVLAARADPALGEAFNRLLFRSNEDELAGLLDEVIRLRGAFGEATDPAALARFLGAPVEETRESALARWAAEIDEELLVSFTEALASASGKTDLQTLDAFVAARAAAGPETLFAALAGGLLTQKGEPRKQLVTKAIREAAPWIETRAAALQESVVTLRNRLGGIERRDATAALHRVAEAMLERYRVLKQERAALDYDDLIAFAVRLLERSDARDWVRFKLDGGIEHILVDEAQDTSPEQWKVIRALAEEFFAGEGVEPRGQAATATGRAPLARTIFAVGDEKQSIYSFQGAAPELLGHVGEAFDAASQEAARRFERKGLATSFRSAPAILSFVDRVFETPEARAGLSFAGGEVRHIAHKQAEPGRVDVWPIVTPREAEEPPAWDKPVDAAPPDTPMIRLAETVAGAIAGWIGRESIPDGQGGWRKMRAGDVMVLVRKRSDLSKTIIKRLKQLGAPVAGDDRLRLLSALAVKDLIALGRFALLPEDDLTVATLLRSPLCGLSEEDLFDLAHNRPGKRPLYYALQERRGEQARFAQAYGFLAEAQRRADFERPYDFYSGILGRLGARARLVARLGAEAEDPIDELLAQALRFESSESPTLTGFLGYIAARDEEIKRETARGRDEVRVLTVHGAKGLEAPVVVLPDTTGDAGGGRMPALLDPGRLTPEQSAAAGRPPPIWLGRTDEDPESVTALREANKAREAEESRRLLYVALTRAEHWLVIAGAARRDGKVPKACWYNLASDAAAGWGAPVATPVRDVEGQPARGWRLGGVDGAAPGWTPWPEVVEAGAAAPVPDAGAPSAATTLPDWATRPAAMETKPSDIAPSQLADAATLAEDGEAPAPGPRGARTAPGQLDAARFGVLTHLLLERLPSAPPEARPAAARRVLEAEAPDLDAPLLDRLVGEALGVIEGPDSELLFGPDSYAEAPVAAILPNLGPGEMHGVIDRLIVEPDRILIVDYKTGRRPAETPEPYLRQLAVYARAMARTWPDRRIEAALYWTHERRLEPLDHAALSAAFARASGELDRRRAGS